MEWVSVEERLPDSKGRYLVVSKMNMANGGVWENEENDSEKNMVVAYYDSCGNFNCPYVTHWAKLPPPPKED